MGWIEGPGVRKLLGYMDDIAASRSLRGAVYFQRILKDKFDIQKVYFLHEMM